MSLDLLDKVSLRVVGDDEKNKTITFEKLLEIGKNFQEFINSVALNSAEIAGSINLANFKIELCGFHGGSAIPDVRFTNKIIPTIEDPTKQRKIVNNKLSEILEIAHLGNYNELMLKFPTAINRNSIVETLFNFKHSVGHSKLEIGYFNTEFKPTYTPKPFTRATKDSLMVLIDNKPTKIKTEYDALGTFKVTSDGKTKKIKLQEELNFTNHSLTYSPDVIIHDKTQYILKYPLHCAFSFDDDCYSIKNDMLDIIAVELTKDDAELSFNEQFDYLYNRIINSLDDTLTKKMIEIKTLLKIIVKEIEIYGNK